MIFVKVNNNRACILILQKKYLVKGRGQMNQIKVGFLSRQNYLDKTTYSGALYYMRAALKRQDLQIIDLGSPKKMSLFTKISHKLKKPLDLSKVGSPEYIAEYKKFTALVTKQLQETPCDVIFAPVAREELTFLETKIPTISLSDTTFVLLESAYQLNLDEAQKAAYSEQEFIVAAKATKLVYSSEWAANSAINDYKANPEKIVIIPFGGNLDNTPSISEILSNKTTQPFRLLFVGKDWSRKGGDIAFQTLVSLCEKGFDAELTIVGSKPPNNVKHEKLKIISFLSKNVPKDIKQLNELFLKSNIFISPTRADCSPLVLCEANAYGLPVFTTDVGGIPTIIKNGQNGYMLPLSATGEDYANLIIEKLAHPTQQKNLVESSRKEYDSRLNWNKWAESIHQLVLSLK